MAEAVSGALYSGVKEVTTSRSLATMTSSSGGDNKSHRLSGELEYQGKTVRTVGGKGEAHVFLPLTSHMRFSDLREFYIPFLKHENPDVPSFLLDVTDEGTWHYTSKVVFHQREISLADTPTRSAQELRDALIGKQSSGLATDAKGVTLVAEAIFLFDEDNGHSFDSSFTAAINLISEVQQAYYFTTSEVLELVTLKSLPPLVPGVIIRDGRNEPFSYITHVDGSGNFVRSGGTAMNPKPLTAEQDEAIQANLLGLDMGLMGELLNTQREAKVAYRSGNRINSIILIGLTAELFMKQVLKLVLWERRTDLASAKKIFAEMKSSRTMLKTLYRELSIAFGFEWGDCLDPVMQWRKKVAGPRSKAMHEGAVEGEDALEDAHHAFDELQKMVLKQLEDSGFTLTSSLWSGGLTRTIVNNVSHRFKRWEREAYRYNTELKGSVSDSELFIVLESEDDWLFYLVDRETEVCSEIQVNDYDRGTLADQVVSTAGTFPYVILDANHDYQPKESDDKLVWVPAYQVLPSVQMYMGNIV